MSIENWQNGLNQRLNETYEALKQRTTNPNLLKILDQYEKNLGKISDEQQFAQNYLNTEATWNLIPSYATHTSNDWKTTEIQGIHWQEVEALWEFLANVIKNCLTKQELQSFKQWKSEIGFVSVNLNKKVLKNLQTPFDKIANWLSKVLK